MLKGQQRRNGTGFAASSNPRTLQVKELDPALLVECCSLVKVRFARTQQQRQQQRQQQCPQCRGVRTVAFCTLVCMWFVCGQPFYAKPVLLSL